MYTIIVTNDEKKSFKYLETEFKSIFTNALKELYNRGGYVIDGEVFFVSRLNFKEVEMNWDQFTTILVLDGISWEGAI